MDYVESLYSEGKLLVRAMDWPQLHKGINGLEYDCTTWANEFLLLVASKLSSASSTLIVPNVGVVTYKNMGFLINSDLADCFHISKSDSSSRGNTSDGDFFASKPDFDSIIELLNYIKKSRDANMNEVNINASINSVVGLFINECNIQDELLKLIYIIKKCLYRVTGIDFPIYLYNLKEGKLSRIELTDEIEQKIVQSLKTTQLFYWPDDYDEPVIDNIENIHIDCPIKK